MADDKFAENTTFGTNVAGDGFQVPSGMQMHNPYAIAPGQLPGNFQFAAPPDLGNVEYLFEESNKQQRTVPQRMIYGSGVGYATGLTMGGAVGLVEGLRIASRDANASNKIKLNTVLNSITKRSTLAGNAFGSIGLGYGVANSLLIKARGDEKNDAVNAVAAGAITGAIYGASGGAFRAAVSGGVGGVVALSASIAIAFLDGEVQPLQSVTDAFSGFSSGTSVDY